LANFGLSYINTALQGDIVGALVEKYGSKYSSGVTPLSDVMSKAKSIWERYNSDDSSIPDVNDLMDANYYNGGTEDVLGNPKDPYDIGANLKQNFKILTKEFKGLQTDLPKDLAGAGDFLNSINPFKSNKNINSAKPDEDEGLTDSINPNQQRLPAT